MLSTRQASAHDRFKKMHKIFKNVKILEFNYHIWNHHEKCIQKSTNIPVIGSLFHEIDVKMRESKHNFAQ